LIPARAPPAPPGSPRIALDHNAAQGGEIAIMPWPAPARGARRGYLDSDGGLSTARPQRLRSIQAVTRVGDYTLVLAPPHRQAEALGGRRGVVVRYAFEHESDGAGPDVDHLRCAIAEAGRQLDLDLARVR
jgi:hypothetical protein